MKRRLLLGPPGCGKTERLLREMERHLEAGVAPERIAFVSFTRAAIREARSRAVEKFGLTEDQLPYFRTLHSLCFRQLGLKRNEVFGREHEHQLAELTGEELTGHHDLEGPTLGDRGDALLFLDQYSRNTGRSLHDSWREHGGFDVDWWRLQRFCDAYTRLRQDTALYDFTDMLERFVTEGGPVPVDVALLDEAQDFTPLQWRVVARAFGHIAEMQVAGDDDQSIHRWAGADLEGLLNFDGEREVLHQSFRLPRSVHSVAQGIIGQVEHRYSKTFNPTEHDGTVEHFARLDELDLSHGTWLLLGRTRRLLKQLAAEAHAQGVAYTVSGRPSVAPKQVQAIQAYERLRAGQAIESAQATTVLALIGRKRTLEPERDYTAAELGLAAPLPIWHEAMVGIDQDDRDYLVACLRRGEKLTRSPRVRVETIHGAKGMQAENVLLWLQTSQRVDEGMRLDPDAEHRVFYVGASRASQRLCLLEPHGRYGYPL